MQLHIYNLISCIQVLFSLYAIQETYLHAASARTVAVGQGKDIYIDLRLERVLSAQGYKRAKSSFINIGSI